MKQCRLLSLCVLAVAMFLPTGSAISGEEGRPLRFADPRDPTALQAPLSGNGITLRQDSQDRYVIDTAVTQFLGTTIVHVSSFDAYGRILVELEQSLTGDQWTNSFRRTQTYDSEGNLSTRLFEMYVDSEWTNSERATFTVDSAGRTALVIYERWNVDHWEYTGRESYTYDEFGRLLLEQRSTGDLVQYTYDGEGRVGMELWGYLDDGEWRNSFSLMYSYDTSGRPLFTVHADWNGGQWASRGLWRYVYNPDGNLDTLMYAEWMDGNWQDYYVRLYAYDTQGRSMTEHSLVRYDVWENYRLVTTSYDNRGRVSTWSYRAWADTSWAPFPFDHYTCRDGIGNQYWYIRSDIAFHYREIATAVAGDESTTPERFVLSQNYPNPFNPGTTIRFDLPRASHVTVTVYDVLGREVATLVNEGKEPGTYAVQWDASGVSSGMYFYRIKAGDIVQTKRMMLLR